MVLNCIHRIIGKLKNILSLFPLLFVLIICENEPKEIINNLFQINHLLTGQIFRTNSLICTYDSQFSKGLQQLYSDTSKYIICLIISPISFLYIINNDNIKCKYNIDIPENLPSNTNLIPYIDQNNNNLNVIITYIKNTNIIKNQIYWFIYKLEEGKITSINKNSNYVNPYYPIGDTVFDNSDYNLVFSFFNNETIIINKYQIETGNMKASFGEKCKICLDYSNITNNFVLSSLIISNTQKKILPCYKNNEKEVICYLISIKDNSFLSNYSLSECELNIKTYFFYETNEFVITCEKDDLISIYIINETKTLDLSYSSADYKKNGCIYSNNYFLYYDNSKSKYQLIYDCYNNNTRFKYIKNITEPKNYNSTWFNYSYFFKIFRYPFDYILSNLYKFLEESINIGDNYEIYSFYSNFSFFIKPLNSTNKPNLPDIDFYYCENILTTIKNYWFLSIVIIEINNTNSESLSNKVEYKVFDENYEEVDLSVCENVNISIKYKLKSKALDNKDIKEIAYFRGFGVNLFNISDVFFNELCHAYPNFKFDIILRDRVNLYREFFICEKGCFFENIDENYIYCNCPVENNITTELDEISFGEIPIKFPKYYEIIKCIWLVFSSDDKINNLGFYLITFMLGGHVPIWCYYLSTGVKPTNDYISKEMTKYGYISKRKKSKIIQVNNNKRKKSKVAKKGEGDGNDNQNVDSPPPKKSKKIEGKKEKKGKNENIQNKGIVVAKKKDKKSKKKKAGTYIRSCYIINNASNNNNSNIKKLDCQNSQKIKKKGKKNKTIISKKEKKSQLGKLDKSNQLMKDKESNNSLDPNLMETQNIDYLNNDEEKNYDDFDFLSIHLDRTIKNMPKKESNKILNNYTYEEAIEYDKRSLCKLIYIFLLSRNILFRIFLLKSPFDSISVYGCALIFIFSNYLFYNILFYNDEIVSKRYRTEENVFSFTFSTNMPNIFYSLFVVYGVVIIISLIINNTKRLRGIFQKEEEKLRKDANYTVIEERKKEILKELEDNLKTQNKKNYAFFIIEILVMLLYWYYITAFCHVFSNSQVSWILNTFSTIILRNILNFLVCFLFAIIYKVSLSQKSQGLYNAALFIYNL